MSSVDAIDSSKIAATNLTEGENKNTKRTSFTASLTQPVKDSFKKAYGENAEPTPSLVADFAADNLIKAGIAIGGAAILLAKSRKHTSGLTSFLKKNISEVKNAANNEAKAGFFKSSVDVVKKTWSDLKLNNVREDAEKAVKNAMNNGEKSFFKNVKNSLLRPAESFDSTSGLGKFIDDHFAKNSDKIKSSLTKVGITNGADAIDTAVAVGATALLSSGTNEIADDVTSKDNKELAHKAKVEQVQKIVDAAEKIANATNVFVG